MLCRDQDARTTSSVFIVCSNSSLFLRCTASKDVAEAMNVHFYSYSVSICTHDSTSNHISIGRPPLATQSCTFMIWALMTVFFSVPVIDCKIVVISCSVPSVSVEPPLEACSTKENSVPRQTHPLSSIGNSASPVMSKLCFTSLH